MKNRKGYTLVEVIISMLLIMIVMIYLLRTIIVLINKNTDLLTYQEFSVYEDNLLNNIYNDIKLAYEADKLVDDAVEGNGNEITFKDINKKIVLDEENETITYNDTIYQLPENVTFRKVDNKLYNIKGLFQSTHDYYIVTIHVKVNKNDEDIKIIYQNRNDSDLRIVYNPNGGEFEDSEYVGVQHVKYGLNVLQTPAVKRRGYTFSKNKTATGWYTKAYEDDETVSPADEAKREEFIKGPIIYYAHWTLNHYNITYDLAGGSLPSGKTNPQEYTVKTDTITLNNPTKTGYTFKGWSGTDLTGDTNKNVTIPKNSINNRSYKANWTPHTYTVVYNGNGATGGSTASSSHTYGVSKALTSNGFTRTGYSFNGWNTKADGSGTNYSNGQNVSNLTATDGGTVNLYAKWSVVNYTITYTLNGGSVGGNPTSYNINTASFTLKNPTKSGYNFSGWSGSGSGKSVTISKGSTGNKSFTANYNPKKYTVTYKYTGSYSGCTGVNGATATTWSNQATFGSNYRPEPNWWNCPGWEFVGWYGSDGYWWPPEDWTWEYDHDVTLTAQWRSTSTTCTSQTKTYYRAATASTCPSNQQVAKSYCGAGVYNNDSNICCKYTTTVCQ